MPDLYERLAAEDENPLVLEVDPPVEDPINLCANCGAESPEGDEEYNSYLGLTVCESCHERYTWYCEHCSEVHDSPEGADECCPMYECRSCGAEHSYESDADDCCGSSSSDIPYLGEVEYHEITVPVIAGRPARLCSLEQEVASGASYIARLLYEEGVCNENYVRDYHSSHSGEAGMIHIEQDGSLPHGGGEVVYDRFNLSYPPHQQRLSRVAGKIRQLRDEHKLVKTSFAAGIHVHISLKAEDGTCLSPRDVANLYEVWCYAEDMLYSLSAAGWNRHRQPTDDYGGYCKAVPKVEGEATPTKVWRAMRADRYYGLNFQRLYAATTRCSCGASGMGDWEGCDCGAMNSATIEWRVFNASTLPRTLHAWIVMAQAMTAYAKTYESGSLLPNAYGSQTASEKREVLNHLLAVLPLTEGEKALILDAANRSPGL